MMLARIMIPPPFLQSEDWDVWCWWKWHKLYTEDEWLRMIDSYEAADRRDAELMFEAAWRSPGHTVITIDCGADGFITHSIAGRKVREEFEHWLENQASEEDRRAVYSHRAARNLTR